jgi:hypothetical protein
MVAPKDPTDEKHAVTRPKAAKLLGVTVTTFRRKYEPELRQVGTTEKGFPLFPRDAIQEIIQEEHPPETPEESAVGLIKSIGASMSDVAGSSADAFGTVLDALDKNGKRVDSMMDRLMTYAEGQAREVEKLRDETAAMRAERTKEQDELAKRNREDREFEATIRRKERVTSELASMLSPALKGIALMVSNMPSLSPELRNGLVMMAQAIPASGSRLGELERAPAETDEDYMLRLTRIATEATRKFEAAQALGANGGGAS